MLGHSHGNGTLRASSKATDQAAFRPTENSGTLDASRTVRAASQNANFEATSRRGQDDGDIAGTFASFASFDDDDEDAATWAKPLDARPATSNASAEQASTPFRNGDHDGVVEAKHTLREPSPDTPVSARSAAVGNSRRPELRLTIDPPRTPLQETRTGDAHRSHARLPSGSPKVSAGLSPGIHRNSSFVKRDHDWAFRPPTEQLYENLDDFFPRHDLDKPILDAGAIPSSPMAGGSPRTDQSQQTAAPRSPTSASSFNRHKKSIRRVAEDRMRSMERHDGGARAPAEAGRTAAPEQSKERSSSVSGSGDRLIRRRSTKLWGTKLLEMTPGSETAAQAASATALAAGEAPSTEATPRPVFKWVKGDLIGKGTFGRVYIALNATTGEMIAVKQVELPRTESEREDHRQKGVVAALKSEIDTLKDLDHPNIVSYLGFEETSKYLHLFLEYVPGGSIASVLRKYGAIEESTVKFFVHQILSGLAYLHGNRILHRDLKGDNLLLTLDGTVKISDFGTVRKSEDIYGDVASMSVAGSVPWMAPEVFQQKGYSGKADIWSLGCLTLEMLAGNRPWNQLSIVQVMMSVGGEGKAPPIPPEVAEQASPACLHLLKVCFEVLPEKRPSSSRLLEHIWPHPDADWRFADSPLQAAMQETQRRKT